MKALIYTIFVMTIVVWGFPVLELFVIKSGWGIFAVLIALLILVAVLTPGFIWYVLLRYTVQNNRYSLYCKVAILLGMINTIYRLWEVKPEGSGSLGMSTAVVLTAYTVMFSLGFFQQTNPTAESKVVVMIYDLYDFASENGRRSKEFVIHACLIGLVVLIIGYFFGSCSAGRGKNKEALQPYDRVFFVYGNSQAKCFHRDYNCKYIRRSRYIGGTSLLMAESNGLTPCKKCTEPYGIVHHITPEEYKEHFENTEYVDEETAE